MGELLNNKSPSYNTSMSSHFPKKIKKSKIVRGVQKQNKKSGHRIIFLLRKKKIVQKKWICLVFFVQNCCIQRSANHIFCESLLFLYFCHCKFSNFMPPLTHASSFSYAFYIIFCFCFCFYFTLLDFLSFAQKKRSKKKCNI